MWFCILGALRLVFVSLGTQKRCEVSRGEMMKIQEGFIACEHKTEPGLKVESHPWSSSGNHKSGKVCKRDEDGQRYVSRFPFFSSAPRLAVAETGPSVYVCVWSVECGRIESSRRDDACVKPPTWAGGKPSPVQCSLLPHVGPAELGASSKNTNTPSRWQHRVTLSTEAVTLSTADHVTRHGGERWSRRIQQTQGGYIG